MWVDQADDRQDQQALADLQYRSGQLPDRFLLLTDRALALLHEADRNRGGDAVGGGLVGIENAIQPVEIAAVQREQRSGEDVAQQEHDPDDLVGLYTARDDALRQVARIRLQRLESARLQRLDIVVVDGRRFGEHLLE